MDRRGGGSSNSKEQGARKTMSKVWACLCGSSDMIIMANFSHHEDLIDIEMGRKCPCEGHLKVHLTVDIAFDIVDRLVGSIDPDVRDVYRKSILRPDCTISVYHYKMVDWTNHLSSPNRDRMMGNVNGGS